MEGGMDTGVGASGLGQEPEREEGDFRISETEWKHEELQGSIDVVIEDWKSDAFKWWASTPEGSVALQLMFEVGKKIGEYRARMNAPAPPPESNLNDLTPRPTEAHTEQAKAEAAEQAAKDEEIAQLRAQVIALEEQATAPNPEPEATPPADEPTPPDTSGRDA